ncbi:MAG: YHS domain-containing protein, partial [Planctomycetota bacterium]
YVQLPGTEKPTYQGREVVLGPRATDYYIVESGLAEGETIVTNGNFKIDSALQIQAKPSMMSAPGSKATSQKGEPVLTEGSDQTICPVMGGAINKEVFTEYKGKKVYFCCPGCEPKFEADPEKYITQLPQFKQ